MLWEEWPYFAIFRRRGLRILFVNGFYLLLTKNKQRISKTFFGIMASGRFPPPEDTGENFGGKTFLRYIIYILYSLLI